MDTSEILTYNPLHFNFMVYKGPYENPNMHFPTNAHHRKN